MKESDPYMEGYEAYMGGQNREDNPYEFSTLAEESWNEGWEDAQLDEDTSDFESEND